VRLRLAALALVTLAVSFAIHVSAAPATNPIKIAGNSDFTLVGTGGGCGCVTAGSGTASDPWLIQNITIHADNTPGVSVSGVDQNFVLSHLNIHTSDKAPGILLSGVTKPSSITQVNIDSPGTAALKGDASGVGIELQGTMNVTIEGNSINTLSGWGIRVDGGSNNEIRFMTVTHTGLANPASKDTAILFGLPGNPWLTGETGDAVGGILLKGTSNNYVHDNLLNEDGYVGIELVNSSWNRLDKINVRYPDYFGAYLQGSSNNTLTNVTLQTADFDGLLVRESNNNTIKFNTFSANGPIGNEWAAGIVPYFVAGAYVGWGSGGNIIEANNGNFGNTGPDLELDNGSVPTPTASVQGGVIQSLNPLNTSTGGDPGGSVVFGSSNVVCGNSFATNYWFPSTLNANSPCPKP